MPCSLPFRRARSCGLPTSGASLQGGFPAGSVAAALRPQHTPEAGPAGGGLRRTGPQPGGAGQGERSRPAAVGRRWPGATCLACLVYVSPVRGLLSPASATNPFGEGIAPAPGRGLTFRAAGSAALPPDRAPCPPQLPRTRPRPAEGD